MSELSKLLTGYQQAFKNSFDADRETPTADPKQKKIFIEQLKQISDKNRVFLWINVGMLLLVFLASLYVGYHYLDKPDTLVKIFGISGLTVSGMIYYMTYLWRQIVGINMAVLMADKLDPKTLPVIINSLLSTIKKPKKG